MALALGIAGLLLLPQPWNVVAVVLAAMVEVGEVFVWINFISRYRIRTGAEGMIGESPWSSPTSIQAAGVTFRGEGWKAVSADGQPIPARTPVTVTEVNGLTLTVRGNGN